MNHKTKDELEFQKLEALRSMKVDLTEIALGIRMIRRLLETEEWLRNQKKENIVKELIEQI